MRNPVVLAAAAATFMLVTGIIEAPMAAAAPKRTQAEKNCDDARDQCKQDCTDTLIDIGNNIQNCKDRCDDTWILCLPIEEAEGQTGSGHFNAQVNPDMMMENAPAETGPSAPAGRLPRAPASNQISH